MYAPTKSEVRKNKQIEFDQLQSMRRQILTHARMQLIRQVLSERKSVCPGTISPVYQQKFIERPM